MKLGKIDPKNGAHFLRLHGEERGKKTPDFLLRSGLGSHPKNPLFSFLELPLSSGNSNTVYHNFRVLSNGFLKKWFTGGVKTPVFRDFLKTKGAKIPKIVTYHTAVKTMFMHFSGTLFAGEKRSLAEAEFRPGNGREAEGKKRGRRRHKKREESGRSRKGENGFEKRSERGGKEEEKTSPKKLPATVFRCVGFGRRNRAECKFPKETSDGKTGNQKRNKTGNKQRQASFFRGGEECQKSRRKKPKKRKTQNCLPYYILNFATLVTKKTETGSKCLRKDNRDARKKAFSVAKGRVRFRGEEKYVYFTNRSHFPSCKNRKL